MIKICFSAFTDDHTTRTCLLGQKTVIFKLLLTITNGFYMYIDRSAQNIEDCCQLLPSSRSIALCKVWSRLESASETMQLILFRFSSY